MNIPCDAPVTSAGHNTSYTKDWLRALEKTAQVGVDHRRIFPIAIEDVADRFGTAPALLSHEEKFTFADLTQRTNRYARWAIAHGIKKGDVVGLLMPNRPEYLAIWLGITSVGGVVALLNTNLVGQGLAHCIDITSPKHVIIDAENIDNAAGTFALLKSTPVIWSHGPNNRDLKRLDLEINRYSGQKLSRSERPALTTEDRALYVYTSGTTGLPKGAIIDHHRLMMWTHWFAAIMNTGPNDRMYNTLPMYHSVGGAVATGAVLINGGSVVIEKKFSAHQFWDEIIGWDCTLFQYIGELCRYLLNSPPHPRETEHGLRLCCGNGLRMDIWTAFKDRFHIPKILEFYAATEGNVSLYNLEGIPGSIGRIPPFLVHRFPMALIKVNTETNEPARNSDGFCIPCKSNETGEAIGKIRQPTSNLGSRFEGYIDSEDFEKKILRDVLAKGDAWFRTGDLMRKDKKGYFYFIDRIGDTFRWKGENVSTSEVSEAISDFPGIVEVAVYGVTVPGNEGRAGMTAVVASTMIDMDAFRRHLVERLPSYALPLFVRITTSLDMTATFKQAKNRLISEGYDPTAASDGIYFNDAGRQAFRRVDKPLFDAIQSGRLRF